MIVIGPITLALLLIVFLFPGFVRFVISLIGLAILTGMILLAFSRENPATAPKEFAWHKGEPLPLGVRQSPGQLIPPGYELRSGATHNCPFPECMWLVRVDPEDHD